jgi:hypothetical protein
MPSQRADQFAVQASALAQGLGIQHIVIAIVEPETGQTRVIASPGAMEATQAKLLEKLGGAAGDELAGYGNNFGA